MSYVVKSKAGYYYRSVDGKADWVKTADEAKQYTAEKAATLAALVFPLALEEVFLASDIEDLAIALELPPGASLKMMCTVARAAMRKARES